MAQSGLIDLSEIGITAIQEDLDSFLAMSASQSLVEKASKSGHIIDIAIKENFIVDASKDTHSYEGYL